MSLEPIDPETALELYLADRATEITDATNRSHESRLGHFVRWCDEQGIDNLNDLTGRRLHEFRLARFSGRDVSPVTEKTQMDTLRVFIRWLESVDGVSQDLSTKVLSPDITPEQNSRDVMLDADRATEILGYLEKYEYASIEHVTIALLWHTMMRVGALHSLGLKDYDSDGQFLSVRHRLDQETPIKNKQAGERLIALSSSMCDLLDDWIADQRPSVIDDHDREPLVTTNKGRASISALRTYVYRWSQPCRYGKECAHDRDPEECEARTRDCESTCPSSVSPHPIRRGSITHSLNDDVPDKVVSDRANASQAVIEQHYDRRSEREKMEQRRKFLDDQ